MAIKEMWIYLLAYNLIRLMMAQAALQAGRLPRQFSFKHNVQIRIAWDGRLKEVGYEGALCGLFVLSDQTCMIIFSVTERMI